MSFATRLTRTLTPALLALGLAACAGDPAPLPDAPPHESPTESPVAPPSPVAPDPGAVRLIFDTDFGLDVDDVGALALIHKLADAGEAALLGVVSNVRDPYAPAAIDVINTYYGRPDVPIGLTTLPYYAESYPYWRSNPPRYIKTLAERFPHDTPTDAGTVSSTVPSAVGLYRELLAGQPDGSVTVVSVGFMQNLAGLMTSGPDAYSPLTGDALIRQKVRELVVMGGHYPSSTKDIYLTGGREMGPSYAMEVLTDWPTRTVFNTGPVCQDVKNGHTLAEATPETNPVRAAYALFNGGKGRMSWDLCSVLYAARGLSGPGGHYFEFRTDEHLTLDESGYNTWVAPGNGRHVRLVRVLGDAEMQGLFEELLVAPPADNGN